MITDEKYQAIENAYQALNKGLNRAARAAKDVMDYPDRDERESMPYLINQVMDSAHEIIDLAHEFKATVHAKE